MANVKMIAPQTFQPEHMRVAAYCRVSSDSKDQLHSYAAQIRSYTEEIAQHDGWELVDVYADEGLTGTRMDMQRHNAINEFFDLLQRPGIAEVKRFQNR